MKTMKRLGTVVFGLCLAFALGASAKETTPNSFKEALSHVPAVELPAKAAGLVAQAKLVDQESTTIAVVIAAVDRSPAAAPAIVGAIAKAVPGMAKTAAATAAALQPKLAHAIAKAATVAAPIMAGDAAVRPTLVAGSNPLPPSPPVLAPGPSIGPPYTPPSGTPGNVTPNTSGPEPAGGRNYASP